MSSASLTSSSPPGPTLPKPEIRTNRATCRGRASPTRKVCRNTCLKTYRRYRRSRTRNSAPITIATFGTASSSTNPNRGDYKYVTRIWALYEAGLRHDRLLQRAKRAEYEDGGPCSGKSARDGAQGS